MLNRFSCPLTVPVVAAAVCAVIPACAARAGLRRIPRQPQPER